MTKTSTKASGQVSEIDRLIELASDEKPHSSPRSSKIEEISASRGRSSNHALSLEDRKEPAPSMWRVLLQLRVLLPYLARVLPLLERGVLGTNVLGGGGASHAPSADTSRFDRGIEDLQGAHRDLTTLLKSQTADIQQLQEQMTWLSRSLELETQRQEEISESVAALRRLVRAWAILVTVLLVALLGAVLFLTLSRVG
jgi:hypothetical protein